METKASLNELDFMSESFLILILSTKVVAYLKISWLVVKFSYIKHSATSCRKLSQALNTKALHSFLSRIPTEFSRAYPNV